MKTFTALAFCACIFTVTAFAAYRTVYCDVMSSEITSHAVCLAHTQYTTDHKILIGSGKGSTTKQVIHDIFGYDLTSYYYVSFGELWEEHALDDTLDPLQSIAADIFVACEEGNRLPLGFLCQGNTVFTIVEQADGTALLTKYHIALLDETQHKLSYQKKNAVYEIENQTSTLIEKDRLAHIYQ